MAGVPDDVPSQLIERRVVVGAPQGVGGVDEALGEGGADGHVSDREPDQARSCLRGVVRREVGESYGTEDRVGKSLRAGRVDGEVLGVCSFY